MLLSKATNVHARFSQYLFVFVTLYPFEGVLDKYSEFIDKFIEQAVSNANSETRLNGSHHHHGHNLCHPNISSEKSVCNTPNKIDDDDE